MSVISKIKELGVKGLVKIFLIGGVGAVIGALGMNPDLAARLLGPILSMLGG